MNKDIEKIFISKYSKEVEFDFVDGELKIDMKSWKKFYDKSMKPLKEELKKPEYAEEFTRQKRKEYWLEECSGSVAEWEIETILFNTKDFVVDTEQVNSRHKISEFKDLESNPLLGRNKKGFPEYELSAMTGGVVNNNTQKKYISLLTKESGVVIIKMNKKSYTKYHEKLENQSSWFERGTKLVCVGYNDGESLQLRSNNIYRKPLIKVNGSKNYTYQNEKNMEEL